MRECTLEDIDKAIKDLNILLNADAVRGVKFGESYRNTLELSIGALEDKREEIKKEGNRSE